MYPRNRTRTSEQNQPNGFTLIELLVAIGIIAILAGLLLTGVQSARTAVKKAEVAQELRNLEAALTQFHAEFGMYPPSSITLYGTSSGWNGDVRSKSIIQKLWPNYDFTQELPQPIGTGSVTLNGAECLVFFLGGLYDTGALNVENVERGFIGFSKNPRSPFNADGSNRIGPFHEFIRERVWPQPVVIGASYLDTFPGQQNPIWYMSSYEGSGYRIEAGELPPGMKDCYRQGFSLEHDGSNWSRKTGLLPSAWGMKSYQLISPGPDMVYGLGGYYADGMKKPNGVTDVLWNQFRLDRQIHPERPGGLEGGDEDNITSISSNMR